MSKKANLKELVDLNELQAIQDSFAKTVGTSSVIFSSEQLKALEKMAVEINVDPNLLVEEAKKMRVVEEDRVRNYSSLLFQIVAIITRLGAQATELGRAKDALQKAHNGLELRVQERTAELAEANKRLEQEVAARKQVEEALLKSEQKFRNMAYDLPSMIFVNQGGKVVYANQTCHDLMGYTLEEFLSPDFNFLSLIAPESLERIKDKLNDHIQRKEVPSYEYTLLTKDGKRLNAMMTTRLIDYEGESAILGIITDITERKQAEDSLRESEEKVRSITASAHDAIIMVDNEETISFWNDAAERIFGYTEEEMIGTKLHGAIIPERFHEAALTGFKSFRETGQGAAVGKTLELAANRKDGTEFPVELSLSAVKRKGKWNGIGIIRDITELKKKTEAMKRFNKLAVGRELRMVELKKEINALLEDLGKEPRYKIVWAGFKKNYEL